MKGFAGKANWLALMTALVLSPLAMADSTSASFSAWMDSEATRSFQGLFANIEPTGTAPGIVIASPQRAGPNYFYHWIRDAALTMDVVRGLYERSSGTRQGELKDLLFRFAKLSRQLQLTSNPSGAAEAEGMGEPKFNVDGSAFTASWGRPQNDGPALRASVLSKFAVSLLDHGTADDADLVRNQLYDSLQPTHSVIKRDLEYIAHYWSDTSFDLWEEVRGHHFYTRLVQRRALLDGAVIADRMGDFRAADFYRLQAHALEAELLRHWSAVSGYLLETLDRDGGNSTKVSNLDVGVILGVLHADGSPLSGDGFFSSTDDRVLATAAKLGAVFGALYPINQIQLDHDQQVLAPAIGRYPEDQYNGGSGAGLSDLQGNPWVLATLGLAELHYRVAHVWSSQSAIFVTETNLPFFNSLLADSMHGLQVGTRLIAGSSGFDRVIAAVRAQGDAFAARVKSLTPADGGLAEQLDKQTGLPQSARDLTWNYAAFLTMLWNR